MKTRKRHRKIKKLLKFLSENLESIEESINLALANEDRNNYHYYAGKKTAIMEIENEIFNLIGE